MSNYRFLACVTSFCRPIECLGQIHRFMNMNYDNYALSVSVRGVTKDVYFREMYPEVKKYVDDGRLTIGIKLNSNFLMNLVQTYRQYKGDFDYAMKIDDDDWYSLDYMKVINEEYGKLDYVPSGSYISGGNIPVVRRCDDRIVMNNEETGGLCGGSLVFHRDLCPILTDFSNNLGHIRSVYNKYKLDGFRYVRQYDRGRCEDNLVHSLIRFYGDMNNRKAVVIDNPDLYAIYRIYPGVMRR